MYTISKLSFIMASISKTKPSKPQRQLPALPQSVSNFWQNFFVLIIYSVIFWVFDAFQNLDFFFRFTIFATLITLTIAIGEKILYKRVVSKPKGKRSFSRNFYRYIGMIITLSVIAFFYWLFPEYRKDYYSAVLDYFKYIALFCVIAGYPYFYYLDSAENDGYLELGRFVFFKNKKPDLSILAEHSRKWLIKGFFLPLMIIYCSNHIKGLQELNYEELFSFQSKWIWYTFIYKFSYYMDVAFAAIGYLFTLKIFNSEIKSTEPTLLGWFVALMCYTPFWTLFSSSYLQYGNGYSFHHFLLGWTCLICAIAILFCLLIYGLSTVALGIRFSNLTYRGLVSDGPYRFTKHPAYVAKNISWWLISVPFWPVLNWHESFRLSFMLFLLNVIYYIRAKTEENHLSKYKEYVEYGLAMNQRSIFRHVAKVLPFLKYKAPVGYKK